MAANGKKSSISCAQILGEGNWEKLLDDPIQPDLLNLILRCGDFVQVAYDAFNDNPLSKYCGASRYREQYLLSKTFFPFAGDFTVTKLLYASADQKLAHLIFDLTGYDIISWSTDSNFIGYVAVTTDDYAAATGRRDIVVVWRGTRTTSEWMNNLLIDQQSVEPLLKPRSKAETMMSWWGLDDPNVPAVMDAWMNIYTYSNPESNMCSARDMLLREIDGLVNRYSTDQLSVTCVGHSLGGALATLSAFDIAVHRLNNNNFPVRAVVFSGPKIGNEAFLKLVNRVPNLKILAVKNKDDIVPQLPNSTPIPGFPLTLDPLKEYVDVTAHAVLQVDMYKSPFLKKDLNVLDRHNLQALLHTVAGWQGENKDFKLRVDRSVALVNKSCSVLKDELKIPESWWQIQNKGMVMLENGHWELDPDEEIDELPRRMLVARIARTRIALAAAPPPAAAPAPAAAAAAPAAAAAAPAAAAAAVHHNN